MEKIENTGEVWCRTEIPSDQKAPLRHMLQRLGIDEAALFPDLDHLAKGLISDWTGR